MLVKVWNDNTHEYKEKFRGNWISVPASSFIEMDADEAEAFKSSFSFPTKDEQGRPDPKHFKKIRIELPANHALAEPDALTCHATGQKAATPEDLAKMLLSLSDRLAKDEDAEKEARLNKSAKKENEKLRQKNEELEARLKQIEEKLFGQKGESLEQSA